VFIKPGAGTAQMQQWFTSTTAWTAAHEFGHFLGLGDLSGYYAVNYAKEYMYHRATSIMYAAPNKASQWDIQWALERYPHR
jgi:predicted Zn-dependent protease